MVNSDAYSFRFGSFDIGKGWSDYLAMITPQENEYKILSEKIEKACPESDGSSNSIDRIFKAGCKKLQDEVEASTAKKLSQELDVICLQKVMQMSRVFIRTLEDNGFTVYPSKVVKEGSDDTFSTAIALRTELFTDVENVSILTARHGQGICSQEVAIVKAKLNNACHSPLLLTSLHSCEFTLYNPKSQEYHPFSMDDSQNQEKAWFYIEEAIQGIYHNNEGRSSCVLVGGDMNSNPQNYSRPFDRLKDAHGLKILEPVESTYVNSYDENYKNRVIDYIFADYSCHVTDEEEPSILKRIWNAIVNFFMETRSYFITPAEVIEGFDFTVDGNCSDHKPIRATVSVPHPSGIVMLWDNLMAQFS